MKISTSQTTFYSRYKKPIWFTIFTIMFVLSLDFWNWNKSKPFFFGLPFWILYFIVLTLSLALLFYVFSKNAWRE